MGMVAGNKGGGISEINITPLVDVVLVLLIIFIVVAPLLDSNIPIRIPEQQEDDIPVESEPDNKQIVLQLRLENNAVVVKINDTAVPRSELAGQLQKFYANRADKILFFDATEAVPYGPAVDIMDIVRDQGLILGVVPNEINAD